MEELEEVRVPIKKTRKKFIPTDQDRELVIGLRAIGATHQRIGEVLGISHDTLTRHFPHELEIGYDELRGQIASKLFQMALDGDVTCLIFLAKTRLGWTEKNYVEYSRSPETKIIIDTRDPDSYTDEELVRIIEGIA